MISKPTKKIKSHKLKQKFFKPNNKSIISNIEPTIGNKQIANFPFEDNEQTIGSFISDDIIRMSQTKLRQKKIEYNNKLFNVVNIIIIKLLLVLNFIQILSKNKFSLIQYNISKITLKVKGIGTKIIFGNFSTNYFPNKVLINEVLQKAVNYSYYFPKLENKVELIWNNTIKNTDYMFRKCSDIIEIDLSNFDSSKVTTMASMFESCTSLTSINLFNFDTTQVTNINHMFARCSSLTSLDLSTFKTENVTFMDNMFYGCESLTSLNLSNFITEKTSTMNEMFEGCINLEYINLKNFNGTKLKDFSNDYDSNENYYSMFLDVPENVVICIDKNLQRIIFSELSYITCYNIDCSDNWKLHQKKIVDGTAQCIDYCRNDTSYKFEYNGKCYQNCSNGILNDNGILKCKCELEKCLLCPQVALSKDLCTKCNEDNNYYPKENDSINLGEYINCYNESEGYYLDKIDKIYRKCYYSCKTCKVKGNDEIHNCMMCIDNFSAIKYAGNLGYVNCYKNCEYYYYFDSNNIYHCTLNSFCPEDYPILIEEKGECICNTSESQYIINSTNNIHKTDFQNTNYNSTNIVIQSEMKRTDNNINTNDNTINKVQELLNNKDEIKLKDKIEESNYYDEILESIESIFMSEYYNTSKIDNGEDAVIKDEKITISLSTIENQKNLTNSNQNDTSIDLGQCETLIRNKYNLSDNHTIYIKKVEVVQEGMKIPKIQYEIYSKFSSDKLEKLNLSICLYTKIYLSIPTIISENLDILNSSSGYYNDICYSTTSESGTDISLKDRKNEYSNKAVCQDECEFLNYNYDNQKANCTCEFQEKPFSFDDIKINKTRLYENFIDVKNIANLEILICYKNLFQKGGIIYNIGFYIISLIMIIHIICLFIFYTKQYDIIKNKINDIVFAINNYHVIKSETKGKTENSSIKGNQKTKKKRKFKLKKLNKKVDNEIILDIDENNKPNKDINKQINDNYILENNKSININIDNKEIKRKKIKKKLKRTKKITQDNNSYMDSNLKLDSILDQQQIIKIIKKVKNIMEYKDNEKNSLTYELAIQVDRRTYCEYYISLLRTNHNLISSFCGSDDYNSRIIKINLFFNSFAIGYVVNGLFFDDDTMHKIYVTKGSFSLEYQIAKIIYSSIISVAFNTIIKLLALSNDAIIALKNDKTEEDINKRKTSLENKLRIKFIFYFIISNIFLLFFWYYISIFGAVYINTQSHLLKDTLISFILSLLYPFLITLLPGLFRIHALSDSEMKRDCLYKFSKLLQKF